MHRRHTPRRRAFQPLRHVKFRWLNYQREKLQIQRDRRQLNLLIEQCILAVEPKIKFAQQYRKKMRGGIRNLDNFIQHVTEKLYRDQPELSLSDDIFNSLFIGRENAESFVGKQSLVVEFKKMNGLFEPNAYFGLLRCRVEEKIVFGAKLQNDKVVQDAKKIQFTVHGRSVVACTSSSHSNQNALRDLLYQYLFTAIKGQIFPELALGYQQKNIPIEVTKKPTKPLSPTQVLTRLTDILQSPSALLSISDKAYNLGKYGEIIHQGISSQNEVNQLQISLVNCDKHTDELLLPFRHISTKTSNH